MEIFDATNTSTTLLASVATAVQTTLGDLWPIVALVVGIVLAFVVVRYIIGLFKQVGKR